MKSLTRHFQIVLTQAVLALLGFVSSDGIAGSVEPNPAALAKSATSMRSASDTTNKEVTMLLNKLAQGGDFTKRFDQAAFKKDKEQLVNLVREGGLKRSDVTIEEIASDVKVKIKACFRGVCVSISVEW